MIILGDFECVEWRSDSVNLTSPTPEQCEEVMDQLLRKYGEGKKWWIRLSTSANESAILN